MTVVLRNRKTKQKTDAMTNGRYAKSTEFRMIRHQKKHLFLHTVKIIGLNVILELIEGLVQPQVLQSVVRVRFNH